MSIKFWNAKKDDEVFVRFDDSPVRNVLVYLCDERGYLVSGGCIIIRDGSAVVGVCKDAAKRAGISLDANRAIDRDSLAQICAEMAKRIQGD